MKKYNRPQIDFAPLDTEDVITMSGVVFSESREQGDNFGDLLIKM